MLLQHVFFLLSLSQMLYHKYGFKYSVSGHANTAVHVMIYSIQGLFTTSYNFADEQRKILLLVVCSFLIILFFIKTIINIHDIHFISHNEVYSCIRYLDSFCFFAGVAEILVFFLVPIKHKGHQMFYIMMLFFVVGITIMFTCFIISYHNRASIESLAMNIFLTNKPIRIERLFEFLSQMKHKNSISEKYLLILDLLQLHQQKAKCNYQRCKCKQFDLLIRQIKNEESLEKIVKKIYNFIEKRLVEGIKNQVIENKDAKIQLILLHCDFLFSIREHMPTTLYLCQYYLMKKRKELNFHFSYFIYEIQTLAYKLLKNSSKTNLKLKEFLNINYEIEKVHKTASSLCQNFEKVMYFKALKNSNAKLLFTCEDVLYPIIEFGHQKNSVSKSIKQYYKEQLLGKNSELKYILYYYCKLFNISYDTQIMNELYKGKELFPFFSEIEEELTNKTTINENFMILFFNCENKFVIRYFSTRITELLDFGNEDLL